jgi:hypothetical protein
MTKPYDNENQANLRREIEIRDKRIEELMGMALNPCPFEYGTRGYDDWWRDRRQRVAELEG